MSVYSAQEINVRFSTRNPNTGASTNADSLPTAVLYLNDAATAVTVTITNVKTGIYLSSFTLPTLAIGDVVELEITATVSSIVDRAIVWRDSRVDAIDEDTLVRYLALLARSDDDMISNLDTELMNLNRDFGGGDGDYDPATESLEAIRTRLGDAPEAPTAASCNVSDERCGPIRRVNADFRVDDSTYVTWELQENFPAKTPWTFQLQVGNTGDLQADDWTNVGDPVVNGTAAIDPTPRALGKQLTVHYRVLMSDGDNNQYTSQPSIVLGKLGTREWTYLREITRQHRLKMSRGLSGVAGLIMKKKRTGDPCPRCVDIYTGDSQDAHCPLCHGTRFVGGYYSVLPCQTAELGNPEVTEQRTEGPEGWAAVTKVKGTFLGAPMLHTGDIWIDDASDLRYHVEAVAVLNSIRGVPVTLDCELWQLPFSHEAYSIARDGSNLLLAKRLAELNEKSPVAAKPQRRRVSPTRSNQ